MPTVEAITLSSHAGSSVKVGCLGTSPGVSFGRTSYEQLQDIVTPVKVDRLEHWLEGYPEGQRNYLINGFTNGFSIECHENPSANANQCTTGSNNHKSATEHPEIVTSLLKEELDKNRLAGPFEKKPFDNIHISPLSLRPKKEKDKFRLIHDLSHPKDMSVNHNILKEHASVKYETLDMAIEYIQQEGTGAFLAKTDIKGAFRIIPIRPADRLLLGMKWKGQYYFDKCLAMGCRTSCKIFESFSTALQWICKTKLNIHIMVHVLDDFLFINANHEGCSEALDKFKQLCADIGIPLAPEKTLGPAQVLTFLGIELDTNNMIARLPDDKLNKCKQEILRLLPSTINSVRLKQLQSIIGLLNFACQVVTPGRAFLRRLIDRTCNIHSKYHFVRIRHEDKADLKMWLNFLKEFNGACIFQHVGWTTSPDLHLYTDACKTIGFGAILGSRWMAGEFPPEWKKYNITILELYPIVLALTVWGEQLQNKKLRIHTDNQDLVHVINKKTSKEPGIMPLIRTLVLTTLQSNTLVHAVHIAGARNILADALSRLQLEKFRRLAPHMDDEPTRVPAHLQPPAIGSI